MVNAQSLTNLSITNPYIQDQNEESLSDNLFVNSRSQRNLIPDYLKTFLFTGTVSTADFAFTPFIKNLAIEKFGFCLENFLPSMEETF